MSHSRIRVGCAGWSIRGEFSSQFATLGSHLERYASRFSAVEINSSFYRSHRPETYARWAASTPDRFRFSVKVPRQITHTCRLEHASAPLERFLAEAERLGEKLGPLLVQLPPGLPYCASAEPFFVELRQRFGGDVVCEPRHPTWFSPSAERLLVDHRIARAAVDPAPVPMASAPGGWPGLIYYRLHGSPKVYYSRYSELFLNQLAETLAATSSAWCIFDNTANGEAIPNALSLQQRLEQRLI